MALRSEDLHQPAPGQSLQLPRGRLLGRRQGCRDRRLPRADLHGHQRRARDRARCEDRHSLRRFRHQWRDQARDRQPLEWPGEFQITSAPVVVRGVVIVGSAIADNRRVEAPPGTVRAFDARTGRPRWSFDPLVHGGVIAGHANVWAPMSVDEERGLVFLPTSSPSPDFWGGKRPGNNDHANSVVALARRDRRAGVVVSDRASRCLGLRPAGAADAGADRYRRGHARRRDPADQAGFCVRARSRHRQAGMAGGGTRGAAGRRRGRAAVADAAVSDPCAGAGAATDFGRRCVRPDSVPG